MKNIARSIFAASLLLGAGTLSTQAVAAPAAGWHPSLPRPNTLDGLGVNIHFTTPRAGEMKMIHQGGFKVVRMDFVWSEMEKQRGVYDFSAWDTLTRELEAQGIKPLYILDYVNPLYDNGLSPYTEEGRTAFAKWAVAAAKHFRGRGILWEMYNEPNIGFWKPKPNPDDYVKLALTVGKAFKREVPGEAYIGPAASTIALDFLETCFKGGLLNYWDAVSVHPYRSAEPETVNSEYRQLRTLIARYAPRGKTIPILSAEWGYTTHYKVVSEETQAKYLSRQWLNNLSNQVPISIWYDWHDDGEDKEEGEHHFGTVRFPYFENRDPVYDAKPSYEAARALTNSLRGFVFNKRLDVGSADDYVLLFTRGNAPSNSEVRVVAWTTKPAHEVTLPLGAGRFRAIGHRGETLPALTLSTQKRQVRLSDAPQYLIPEKTTDALRLATAWSRLPLETRVAAPAATALAMTLKNPLARPIRVRDGARWVTLAPAQSMAFKQTYRVKRDVETQNVAAILQVEGMPALRQPTAFLVTNPLLVTAAPLPNRAFQIIVKNPARTAFQGEVVLSGKSANVVQPLLFKAGESEKTVLLKAPADATLRLLVRDRATRATMAQQTLRVAAPFAARAEDFFVEASGDEKITGSGSLKVADAPRPLPGGASLRVLRFDYEMGDGWKFLMVQLKEEATRAIAGKPRAAGLWVYGDASTNFLRMRILDSTGQTMQPTAANINSSGNVDWEGWRYVEVPLNGQNSGWWGGAKDNKLHYPIRWDTLFLLDNARKVRSGTLYFTPPVLIY